MTVCICVIKSIAANVHKLDTRREETRAFPLLWKHSGESPISWQRAHLPSGLARAHQFIRRPASLYIQATAPATATAAAASTVAHLRAHCGIINLRFKKAVTQKKVCLAELYAN